jgi:type IV pilus biogenesis protein CpaD/CtpE
MPVRATGSSIALALLLGCTSTQAQRAEAFEAACEAQPQNLDPVLMTLQTRDHEVIVHSGERGLRFTVALGDRVLFEQLAEAEFAASFPDLHQHFETAFAEERGGWAGL